MNMSLARVENPAHPLSRLAGAGPRRRGGEIHSDHRELPLRRIPRLRELRQGSPPNGEDEENRTALSRPLPAPAQARRTRCRHRADGVLFGSSKAHKTLRKILVEEQKLDAVISLPGGVFKPYAGVSTAILLFTKTNSGGTDYVWFYDLDADGLSLDDKRTPLLAGRQTRPCPQSRAHYRRTRQK